MTPLRFGAVLAFAFSMILPAAAGEIDPGLWEFRNDIQMPGNPGIAAQLAQMREQMRAQLESMPPEQRRMVEQQMQGMSGDAGGFLTGGPARLCLTKEDTEFDVPGKQGNEDCRYTDFQRKGKVWTGRMICDGEDFKGTGTFRTTLHNRRHYTMSAEIDAAGRGRMTMAVEARFIQPDCPKGTR